jgi:arylsulfatase A-like enzyme/Tfp pilus assembly protein PilF
MRTLRLLAVIALLPVAACGPAPGRRVPPDTPIVLISIDTLRSDRLPAYGYDAVETPAIDALSRDGVLFERAYSHVPLTLPAHASLLTGLLPGENGVRDNVGYTLDSASLPLLQRTLRENGYATGAAVSSYVMRAETGIASGFDVYDDTMAVHRGLSVADLQRSGAETARRALEWVETVRDRPFFLLLHLYEPHTPYAPPEPFASRYDSPYDGEVAAADDVVGRFVARLRELGLYERALIVLLSDHGEGLGDHEEQAHGVFLYRTTLQVPLIFKLPGNRDAGRRVPEPAQLLDVFPTIRALLGLKPDPRLRGADLFDPNGSDDDERPIYAETYYPRLHYGWSELTSVIRGPHHLLHGPTPELFDLERDFDEARNLLEEERGLAGELSTVLSAFRAPLETPEPADPETLQRLASLGYVGTLASSEPGDLPDPRSRRDDLRRIREASKAHAAGRDDEAVRALEQVLDDNPNVIDAWEAYARSLESLGRVDEAAEAYREAMRRTGGSSIFAVPAASLLLKAGRLDEARALAEAGRASDLVTSETVLARIDLAAGRPDQAEIHARRASAARPDGIPQRLVLGEVALARGRTDEALEWVRSAQEEYAGREGDDVAAIRGLHLLRGRILASSGEGPAAEVELLKEIKLFPDQTAAYVHLAVLYALLSIPEESERVIDEMISTNPYPAAYGSAIRTLRILDLNAVAERVSRDARKRFPGDSRIETDTSGG